MSNVIDDVEWMRHEIDIINKWFHSPRFSHIRRPYSAEDVARLRSPLPQTYASHWYAKKLFKMFQESQKQRKYLETFGALDPVQVIQMAKYLKCVYVSGWQSSSTASTSNEVCCHIVFFF